MQTRNTGEEFGYLAKEVSLQLDINPSTLRRWCLALEQAGYTFTRNEQNQRIFYERDYRAFRRLKELLNKKVSMENAVHTVISIVEAPSQTPSVHEEVRLSTRDLQEIIQIEVQKALQAEREVFLETLQEKINDSITKRDHQLIKAIRELQEAKQLPAPTKEKKKKWFNFFLK